MIFKLLRSQIKSKISIGYSRRMKLSEVGMITKTIIEGDKILQWGKSNPTKFSNRDLDMTECNDIPNLKGITKLRVKTDKDFINNLNEWDTSGVSNISYMFRECKKFNQPVYFDTSNVINMNGLFYCCKNFNSLISFDTSKVEDMSFMFYDCKNFNKEINFDTSKVEDMKCMFYGCTNFNQPVNFNTSKVRYMSSMFSGCENFNQPVNFDTFNVATIFEMFKGCKKFNQPVNFNISKASEMFYMFDDCTIDYPLCFTISDSFSGNIFGSCKFPEAIIKYI